MAVVLGLLGCQGSDQATSVEQATTSVAVTTVPPERNVVTAEDKVVRWIRSCDVRQIVFSHGGVAYIKFRGGNTVGLRLDETAEAKVSEAAFAQRCEKRISVGIE
jgi:hypothetical protein